MRYHLKLDELKRKLENSNDFTFKKAFATVDDWNYGYIKKSNIKRFLKKMSYEATDKELSAILRRFDLDGDAKLNFKEFEFGLKSFLTISNKKRPSKSLKRSKSGSSIKSF